MQLLNVAVHSITNTEVQKVCLLNNVEMPKQGHGSAHLSGGWAAGLCALTCALSANTGTEDWLD